MAETSPSSEPVRAGDGLPQGKPPARHLARRQVEAWVQSKPSFLAVDQAVAKQGWKIVLLTRLSPVFPFNFQNYAYGLTRISFWHYTLASWVGMIAGTFLYVAIIDIIGEEFESPHDRWPKFGLATSGLALMAVLAIYT